MSHLDVSGREIQTGDYILYAASLGRCPVLRYARVEDKYEIENPRSYQRDRILYKLKVRSVSQYSYGTPWKLLNTGSLITLAFCDRIVVVPTDSVPADVVAVLAS